MQKGTTREPREARDGKQLHTDKVEEPAISNSGPQLLSEAPLVTCSSATRDPKDDPKFLKFQYSEEDHKPSSSILWEVKNAAR